MIDKRCWHIIANGGLPKDGQECFITTGNYDVYQAFFIDAHSDIFNGIFEIIGASGQILYSGHEVLAWMPFELPEPWEGEEK